MIDTRCKIGKALYRKSWTEDGREIPIEYHYYRVHLTVCQQCQKALRKTDDDIKSIIKDLEKEQIIDGELWRLQEVGN